MKEEALKYYKNSLKYNQFNLDAPLEIAHIYYELRNLNDAYRYYLYIK